MEKKYLQLNNIKVYTHSFRLANYVWEIVVHWDYFSKDTIGKQFVRAIDSVCANIAEGFGRYNKKDKIHFYRYSYGSIKESLDWNEKARVRKLLTSDEYQHILNELKQLPQMVHHLINFTNRKLQQ